MGLLDDAKNALSGHEDQAKEAVEKLGDLIDERTDGKYKSQVDAGQEKVEGFLDKS